MTGTDLPTNPECTYINLEETMDFQLPELTPDELETQAVIEALIFEARSLSEDQIWALEKKYHQLKGAQMINAGLMAQVHPEFHQRVRALEAIKNLRTIADALNRWMDGK